MKKFLPVIIMILSLVFVLKFIYISKLDADYPVVGAGRTLRNVLGNQIRCPLNPMVQPSACNFCFGNVCLGN